MAVKRREVESIVVLDLKGKFYGGQETDELEEVIRKAMATGNTRFVLNMSGCARITSPVLSILTEGKKTCEVRGGDIKLCGVGGQPLTLLEMTALLLRFDHYPSELGAVAAFSRKPEAVV